ncbi:hypothetical protein BACT_1386 [Bifidobacterium actinocoloniiforme DSM 22766]|uniref:Cytosolic protein n=1 Tax=Bifidobacterium actinocoloniiforme DSM 22766 TaxID=1437605 RepID=A0A086Z2D2_9BIFI|nr:hypothetical protein [Bifidobacterium actinocoloniiforme]AKV55688.1 hypothetical protein AB656_05260 [Bifidobacterium actinocoloniiforme DSM 22766]KFI40682.1 hypothetical protein BACT_1386 [Bifidobacterium actinocoloniiforme DSM 22766]
MSELNLGDGLRKVMLAGIGALATGVEKSQEIVDQLVEKGELTVNQGKELNTELKRKAAANRQEAKDERAAADAKAQAETQSGGSMPTPTPGAVYNIKTGC